MFKAEARLYRTLFEKSETARSQAIQKLKAAMDSTIQAISLIVEARDPYTAGHQKRVAALSVAMARELGMEDGQVDEIRMGALIHDIGKIHIPSEILTKPSRLTEIEVMMMRTHPDIGHRILRAVDFIPAVARMVHEHHEWIDGTGYPRGISGKDMHEGSKIIAVADTGEAMASHRPYRPSLGINKALAELERHRGRRYDADMVDACLSLFRDQGFKLPDDDCSPII